VRNYHDLRLAPAFISNEVGDRLATAFVVTVPLKAPNYGAMYEHAYLVTAKHCVIDAATRTPRERLRIEFPWMGEQGLAVQPIRTQWSYLSPEDLPLNEWSLDLAVGPLLGSAFTGHQIGESLIAVPLSNVIENRSTKLLGQETVTAGLFAHSHGDEDIIEPVLRFGRVAAVPRTTVESGMGKAEAVLVEGHAAEGMSGAPVFVRSDSGGFDLLGIHVGHFTNRSPVINSPRPGGDHEISGDFSSRTHAGVAIVTPAWRIRDLLNSPSVMEHRRSVEEEIRDFPWRFRDRRHREIRGVVFSKADYPSMSDHPEAQRGRYEYLIHSPADDPYCTYTDELECNTHGAAELGEVDAVRAAVAAEWPSVVWAKAEIAQVSGHVELGGQLGELTLYADPVGQVRAIYLSGFWREIDWGRFREARVGLERSLKRTLWFADVVRGSYAAD
jgi:hypothetical protein